MGREDLLEKEMATHSSILAWKIPCMEEPGRLQSMGSRRVRHDWATSHFTFVHWRRKWQHTPVFLPGESQGQEPGGLPSMGFQSQTWLIWLSSSSSMAYITLHMLNHACIPGINPSWSWCYDSIMCCWIQFVNVFLRIFVFIFIQYTDL